MRYCPRLMIAHPRLRDACRRALDAGAAHRDHARRAAESAQPISGADSSIDRPRAVIGVTTTSAATPRHARRARQLRAPGSPADKAGIEEGNRIASINGVSLKLAPADVGDDQMAGVHDAAADARAGQAQAGRRGRSARVRQRPDEGGQGQDGRAEETSIESRSVTPPRRPRDARPQLARRAARATRSACSSSASTTAVRRRRRESKKEAASRRSTASTCAPARGDEEDGMLRSMNINRLNREIESNTRNWLK